MRWAFLFLLFGLSLQPAMGQKLSEGEEGKRLVSRLMGNQGELVNQVIQDPEKYRLQIIYTQIDRDEEGFPSLRHMSFGYNPRKYFYPASMVKLPVAAMALEKLLLMNKDGVDAETRLAFESNFSCQKIINRDTSAASGWPCIAHYIKKIFLVSDNEAYNQLFQFLGRQHINDRLWNMGFKTARISSRFSGCDESAYGQCSAVNFLDQRGEIIYRQPPQSDESKLKNPYGRILVGEKSWEDPNIIHDRPWDFTEANFISLWDLHQLLVGIVMPEAVEPGKRFVLTDDDRQFMLRYMSMLPRESEDPRYDPEEYHDGYVKYLLYGREGEGIDENQVRIFNKVGLSYGFLTDCAYIVDYKHNTEFFLSATLYVNSDGIVNDGKYEYESLGFPFLKALGKAFLQYERDREKSFPGKPFKIK